MEEVIDLNDPKRFWKIRDIIQQKPALKQLYLEVYHKYLNCIKDSPAGGTIVEFGSGAGFVKNVIPEIVTSDVVAYPGIDKIIDATKMDFAENSLSCICMFNALHHISDSPAFFREALRCLIPGGKILMIEPYPGWISALVYRYLHHEPYDPKAKTWEFDSKGPVSDANIALPYIIFERDLARFHKEFSNLSLTRFELHSPFRYWLTGGLKKWSLLPKWAFNFASWFDQTLIRISPKFGSFVDIEITKI